MLKFRYIKSNKKGHIFNILIFSNIQKAKTDLIFNVCFCENAPSKSLLKRKLFCSFA
jgi:hypothetical protein